MVPAGFSTAATNNANKKKLQKEQITSSFLPLQLALSEALFSKGYSNVLLKYAKSMKSPRNNIRLLFVEGEKILF